MSAYKDYAVSIVFVQPGESFPLRDDERVVGAELMRATAGSIALSIMRPVKRNDDAIEVAVEVTD